MNKKTQNDWLTNMPNSVAYVLGMNMANLPVSSEAYELALKEGGKEYFKEEIEWREKWDKVPQWVKDAYYADPGSDTWGLLTKDDDLPDVIKNWPGILAATNEQWAAHNEYYNSQQYKDKVKKKNIFYMETFNKYFSPYGLTKTLKDYE